MTVPFYENFEKALSKLASFADQGIKDELDRAGLIQAFEFTLEQCWKSIQKRSGQEGSQINSPKQAFLWALGQSWIEKKDEEIWLAMLSDRNLSSHTYREALALEIANRVQNSYIFQFKSLLSHMKDYSIS